MIRNKYIGTGCGFGCQLSDRVDQSVMKRYVHMERTSEKRLRSESESRIELD